MVVELVVLMVATKVALSDANLVERLAVETVGVKVEMKGALLVDEKGLMMVDVSAG